MKQNKFLYYLSVAIVAGGAYKYGSLQIDKDKPILTTAGIVHICPDNKIALIERGKDPKGTAMFGGHVESKESPEEAFKRELKEELNISEISHLELLSVNGNYGRDPRQHSVEVTYTCTTTQTPSAGSDAKSVKLYTIDELQKKLSSDPQSFAFDHGIILEKYLQEGCNSCNNHCR